MIHHYGMDGRVITSEEAMELFAFPERRRVDLTHIERDGHETIDVSTVLLVLDHSFGEGPPLIFETMVFGDIDIDQVPYRYATVEEARAGHDEVVAFVRTMLDVGGDGCNVQPPGERGGGRTPPR